MAKADEKFSTPAQPAGRPPDQDPRCRACRPAWGLQWTIETHLKGDSGLETDPHRHVAVDLDSPPPPPARVWLREAAARLADAKPAPENVTDAARLLEQEMYEAFLRRRLDERWGWGHIKNVLIDENFWPRTRRPKT
jgi:hypothetical protein